MIPADQLWVTFHQKHKDMALLKSIASLLEWDQETKLAPGSVGFRTEQLSWAQSTYHRLTIAPDYLDLIENLNQQKNLTSSQRRTLALELKRVKKAIKIPAKLVDEIARMQVHGTEVWKEARKQNNYRGFANTLASIVELKKQYARCIQHGNQALYEVLLDDFDPEIPLATIHQLLNQVRVDLVPLLPQIFDRNRKQRETNSVPQQGLAMPLEKQRELTSFILKTIGFDLNRGRVDEAVHPFCSGNGWDTRLTTRYRENDWAYSLYSVLHEGGHGMYEQGIALKWGTDPHPLAEAPGMALHESQSRFWENKIGRSHAFCSLLSQHLQSTRQGTLTPSQIYFHVNKAENSYIRTEADEVTYNLHILVRFELEQKLFSDSIHINDLKEAWDSLVNQTLQLKPKDDVNGILQDIHWSGGAFGYFPGYAIGNLIAAQLSEAIEKEFPIYKTIESRSFTKIRDWLNQRLHALGSEYNTLTAVENVTGQPLSHEPFMKGIKKKFLEDTYS